MKLFYKSFFAFFITNLVLVGVMLAYITVNLSANFTNYVTKIENNQFLDSKNKLIQLYKKHGSWEPLTQDIKMWRDTVVPNSINASVHAPSLPSTIVEPPPAKVQNVKVETGKRLSLYDKQKNVIVGKPNLEDNDYTEGIYNDDELIGWLGLNASRIVKNSPASQFLNKQFKNVSFIAIATLIIAFVMAIMFTNHLVVPIKSIINGTNKLTQGMYEHRVNTSLKDELGQLAENLNSLAHTLQTNQSERYQWMSDTSHELRTPLTVLRAQLIAIQDGVLVADEQRMQLFIDEIDNLSHIVNDLYQLSSSDAGGLTYQKSPVQAIQVLMHVADVYKVECEQSGLIMNDAPLQSLINDPNCILLGDKARLIQLFSNLLENCCRYTQSPGLIELSAQYDDYRLKIKIEDSPPGVPHAFQSRLFDRFYRVEQSRNRKRGGSGLGLSLCEQIVTAHEGIIGTYTSPLGGLGVEISFPIYKKLQ